MINKTKQYREYKKSHPEQLDLFSFPNVFAGRRDKYSGTVELYDIVPKYFHGDVEKVRTRDGFLKSLVREFSYKKQKMILRVSPAQIETKRGEKAFYPSQREEIIEDVLRKFATDSNRNEFLDDRLSVKFTLYDLQKELKKIKHTFSYSEIRESLEVLSKTNIEIKSSDGKITFLSNMFETFGAVDENKHSNLDDFDGSEEYSKKITYFVRFNSLVSESIKNKSWRIINYEQCMAYRKVISRWLHKRISHMFRTGNIEMPYNIMLSTIIRDSGMTEYEKISNNIRQVEECLKEMIKIGSIDRYTMEKIYSEERKNKITDVKFLIYVSHTFFDDMNLNCITLNYNKNKLINTEVKNVNNNDIVKSSEQEENQQDLLYINELKTLLKDFSLSDSDLNKILSYKNDKSFSDIKKNIKCAISYINKERDNNRNCNTMAVIISAIKNDWNGQDLLDNKMFDNNIDISDKQEILKNLLFNITNKDYELISQLFIKYFGENVYISWLSKLSFVSIKESSLNLSCNNEFVIDKIKKDYLNGIQAKDSNGNIYWYKKGIKQIVGEALPNIKRINIKYENNG